MLSNDCIAMLYLLTAGTEYNVRAVLQSPSTIDVDYEFLSIGVRISLLGLLPPTLCYVLTFQAHFSLHQNRRS